VVTASAAAGAATTTAIEEGRSLLVLLLRLILLLVLLLLLILVGTALVTLVVRRLGRLDHLLQALTLLVGALGLHRLHCLLNVHEPLVCHLLIRVEYFSCRAFYTLF